jgi:hypothetical protein
MQIRGIVRAAILCENPPGSDRIEMAISVQGVGRDKPRQLIVPFEVLIQDASLDPDAIEGHAFQAEIRQDKTTRWIVEEITFAQRRVL